MIQRTFTRKTKKDYSKGESSPYWDWAMKQTTDSEGLLEDPQANPDRLDSAKALWSRELTQEEEFKLEIIQAGLKKLSKRELQVVNFLAEPKATLESVAKKLKVSVRSVRQAHKNAQKKIERLYTQKKLETVYKERP